MDNRFNTIAGWVLGGGIVLLGASLVTGEYFKSERPETMGYPIAGVVEEGGDGGAAADPPIAALLADRRHRRRRSDFPQVHGLPQRHPGRPERHRSQSLGSGRRQRRPCRRLCLFRRAALPWRAVGLGESQRSG